MPEQISTSDKTFRTTLILATPLLLAGLWHFISSPYAIAGDTAMYLQCGQFLLQGQLPYLDLLELNPPLIMYLSVIPAMLSKACSLPLAFAGALSTSSFALLAYALTAGGTRMVLKSLERNQVDGQIIIAPALFSPVILNALSMFDFGQREHLYSLFLLPFFLLRYARLIESTNENSIKHPLNERLFAIIVGLTLGLMACLKPLFLLGPVTLELYWLVKYRKPSLLFSPEILAAPVPMILYALSFLLLPAEVRTIYFGEVVPLLVKGYSCFNIIRDVMVKWIWSIALTSYLIALLFVGVIPKGLALRAPLVIMLSTALAIIELQQKFWNYHAIPLYLWESFIIIFGITATIQKSQRKAVKAMMFGLLLLTIVAIQFSSAQLQLQIERNWPRPWDQYLAKHARAGESLLLLDTSDTPWFKSALRFNLVPGSRHLWLYTIPMLQYQIDHGRAKDRENARAELTIFFRELGEEIDSRRPKYILLKRKEASGMAPSLDFQKYLLENGLDKPLLQYQTIEDYNEAVLLGRKQDLVKPSGKAREVRSKFRKPCSPLPTTR